MRKTAILLVVLASSAADTRTACAGDFDHTHYVAATIEHGARVSRETRAVTSASFVLLLVNGSLEYRRKIASFDNHQIHAHAGVGLGPALQIQVGYGNAGFSGRIKSTLSPLKKRDWGCSMYKFTSSDRRKGARRAVASVFIEADKHGVAGGVLLGMAL